MAEILHENNLFLIWSENFMYFEWVFYESDIGTGWIESSKFGGKDFSYLQIKQNNFESDVVLFLNNPKRFGIGRYDIKMCGRNNSDLYTITQSSYDFTMKNSVDLLPAVPEGITPVCYPITIICTVRASLTNVAQELRHLRQKEDPVLNHLKNLSLDFMKLLDQTSYSDVVLNVSGDNIKAHKMVLQARSPVFHNMFSHDTSEAVQNTVSITDIGVETMKKLISYMYTGSADKCNFDDAFELYYAADKYEVLSLRDYCRTELLNDIQVNNACSLLMLANRHFDEVLKKAAMKFIIMKFESVLITESFSELNKEDVMTVMKLYIQESKNL